MAKTAEVIEFPSTEVQLNHQIEELKKMLKDDYNFGKLKFFKKVGGSGITKTWCCYTNEVWKRGVQHSLHAEITRHSDGSWEINYALVAYPRRR